MNNWNKMPEEENNIQPEMPDNGDADLNGEDPLAPQAADDALRDMQLEESYEDNGAATDELAASKERVATLEAALAEAKDQMLRAMAEAENTRKRLLREREDVRKYAVSDFARDMLNFSDNFSRALSAMPDNALVDELVKNIITGLETMDKELGRTMEKHGIKKIEPLGEPFNPNFHEAMYEAPTGQPAGTIIELIEPGYVLHDRLLRPARVGIAKGDTGHGGAQVDIDA